MSENRNAIPKSNAREHPKVLLVDVRAEAESALREAGFNVSVGTLGRSYQELGEGFYRVIDKFSLPGLTEQEIVVVDLATPEVITQSTTDKGSVAEPAWWTKPQSGTIDPRPLAMSQMKQYADRILRHGGMFVIFAATKSATEYLWAAFEHGTLIQKKAPVSLDNWSLLTAFSDLKVHFDLGEEVNPADGKSPLHDLLRRFRSEMSFGCTIAPGYELSKQWLTMASNKYGQAVAGAILPQEIKGRILIFPAVANQGRFLTALFQEVLPELSPHLFPDCSSGRWLHGPDYELPRVVELNREIIRIQEAAHREVADLYAAIQTERVRAGFMHDLLSGTGEPLVVAVKKALETLGFASVVNSDLELKPGQRRREDLQIHDCTPVVLVEAKGIAGLPKEEDSIQVFKYIAPRMREWGRTDVKGLSIVNHQRNLPALERNTSPFGDDVVTNAVDQGFGLMTTWDLFRLLRCFLKLNWSPDRVKPLFYQSGRVLPIPVHYENVGIVEHYWDKISVVGIRLSCQVQVGDTLAYELPVEIEEEIIESLHVDRSAVDAAPAGTLSGVKTRLSNEQARKGTKVFRISEQRCRALPS